MKKRGQDLFKLSIVEKIKGKRGRRRGEQERKKREVFRGN